MTLWLLLIALIAQPAAACTVCMGAPGDPLVEGANRGIWVLLAVIFFVQVAFVALFVTFWRRARAQKRLRDQFYVVHEGAAPKTEVKPSPRRWFRRSLAALGINFLGGSQ